MLNRVKRLVRHMDARKASVGGAVGKRQLKQFVLLYVYTCVAREVLIINTRKCFLLIQGFSIALRCPRGTHG